MERHKFERACKLFISRKKHGQPGNVGSGYDVYLSGGLLCLLALLPVMSADGRWPGQGDGVAGEAAALERSSGDRDRR